MFTIYISQLQRFPRMRNVLYRLQPITYLATLHTRRQKKRVVVISYAGRILFIARILKNRYRSSKTIYFDNHKTYNVSLGTVGDEKAGIFFWTEELDDSWQKQCE